MWNYLYRSDHIFDERDISFDRVTAKRREGVRDLASRISHLAERIFFQFPFFHGKREIFLGDFPSHMWEGKRFFWIPLFTWKKIMKKWILSTKMSKISDFLRKGKKFFFHFSQREKKISIFLLACEKSRDCLFIFLFNDYSVFW